MVGEEGQERKTKEGERQGKIQLANQYTHTLMVNLFSSGAPHIHFFPSSTMIMLLSGLQTATAVLFHGDFQGQFVK